MPPQEPSPEVLDSDNPGSDVPTEADALTAAEARAQAARARATRLREQAEAAADADAEPDDNETVDATDQDQADDQDQPDGPAATAAEPSTRRWRPRLRVSRRRLSRQQALAGAAAIAVTCAALAGSGYLWRHHQHALQQTQRSAAFATAARDAVVTMMSIDPNKARDDMQRFADATTGQFKVGILMGAEDMLRAIEQSKVAAKASVQAVGVQSMTQNSAVVLVAAKSELVKADQPKPEVRTWRLVVNVETDAGQLKVSKIEFVP